ncbi:methyltransferase [Massilia sp. Root351]|uniref:CheR family methyltransferase n=1 Tax=Massilia sp. Root351 TaxID=1736522 RepID=UPI00070BB24B|nr:protein-glutamate O-methyltransferase CheR [Massilia sp. Root351]KQV83688.1 methyltransferase [Massilia sp. Root351]
MSAQAMLRRVTGLTVSKAAADRAIRERMELTGEVNRERYLAALTQEELTELVELVVVPESWLFRDAQAFQVAVEFVQGRLARRPAGTPARPVRILSVPCAGGEEPYSLAMALCDADVPRGAFSIDACDLSPGCVARARRGVYGRNAFRAQDLAFRERYFTSVGNDDYLISEAIRAQVRFSQGNLLELDAGGRRYDIIFCRNLLIYFDKPTTKAAIERLSALLADDGILFAGYAEVPSFAHHGFTPLPHRQAFGLRKDAASAVLSMLSVPANAAPAGMPPPFTAERRKSVRPQVLALAAAPAMPRPEAARRASAPATAFSATSAAMAAAPAAPAAPIAARAARPSGAPSGASPVSGAAARAPAAPAPPCAAELLLQARKLADRGETGDAEAACRAVLAAAPETAGAYFILGMLSEHAGQSAQAEEHWRRCIYLQPDHYEALCHLALLAEQSGNSSGAATLKARAARIYQRQQKNSPARAEP